VQKISSGIKSLDRLIDSFYTGDNVVWEVDSGYFFASGFSNTEFSGKIFINTKHEGGNKVSVNCQSLE
jgi:hypothetical protein